MAIELSKISRGEKAGSYYVLNQIIIFGIKLKAQWNSNLKFWGLQFGSNLQTPDRLQPLQEQVVLPHV